MNLQEFLKYASGPALDQSLFVQAPDNLGVVQFLPRVLGKVLGSGDLHTFSASLLSKQKVRDDIEKEARRAPAGASRKTHFFIHGASDLSSECVGPLLKIMEDGAYARFVLQAASCPRKIWTLRSRCQEIRLPFLSKRTVLGNLKAMKVDVGQIDELGLFDGTMEGTRLALVARDKIQSVLKADAMTIMGPDFIKGDGWSFVLQHATRQERLWAGNNENRRRLVAFEVSRRLHGGSQ